MAIDFQREEYNAALPEWQLVDTVADERELDTLLPKLNASDNSKANEERNKFYRDRASWFGATSITLTGLVGIAFEDEPEIDLPGTLEYLRDNVDGSGLDLDQQMQRVCEQVLRKGRCGLFITYPQTEGDTSRAAQAAGNAVSTVHMIDAKRIINWWTVADGANVKLGGVVFTDTEEVFEDYEIKVGPILRELALEDGGMIDRIWRRSSGAESKWVPDEPRMPVDGAGRRWQELPFVFVGALDNTHSVDRPPLLSLARLNRDHYRNSADNEESVWYAGQAQPYLEPHDGMQMDDVKQAEKDGFYIGSRQMIIGKMGFAQADPNTAARQAMIDKMDAMKALGARFLMPGTVAKTATESSGEQKVQHSILSLISVNVEAAYARALGYVAAYMNAPEPSVVMSRDFMRPEATPELIDRLIALIDRGYVSASDALPMLKRARFVDPEKTAEEYEEEVAQRGGMIEPVDDGATT